MMEAMYHSISLLAMQHRCHWVRNNTSPTLVSDRLITPTPSSSGEVCDESFSVDTPLAIQQGWEGTMTS